MKRGSLVGPLLIILVGMWFLVASLRPDLPLLDVAARFWPFLLIGWGVARLLELFAIAHRRRPLPVTGVSGGEWTLIVLICLIGSGLYAANSKRPWDRLPFVRINKLEMFGRGYDYPITEQRAAAAGVNRILVENLRGTTRVIGGDVQEIIVSGRKSVRALDQGDADTANRNTSLELSNQGGQVVVRTNQDRITGEQRVSSDLDITVPRSLALEIRGRQGELEVTGLNGAVEISSDNADLVRLQNLGGSVRLDIRKPEEIRATDVKGGFEVVGGRGRDLELENIGGEVILNGTFSGDMKFRQLARTLRVQADQTELRVAGIPGHLNMDLGHVSGTNVVGPIRMSTSRSRDVQFEEFTHGAEIVLERGDIVLRPAQKVPPPIDARTRRGEVELRLPAGAAFEIKAAVERGEITNDFGDPLKVEERGGDDEDRRGAVLTGRTGAGASIVLNATRGAITIKKDEGRLEEASADSSSDEAGSADAAEPEQPARPERPARPDRRPRGMELQRH